LRDVRLGLRGVPAIGPRASFHAITLGLGFVLFPRLDIWKPVPVGRAQRLPGKFGVVIDDVLAGVYTQPRAS